VIVSERFKRHHIRTSSKETTFQLGNVEQILSGLQPVLLLRMFGVSSRLEEKAKDTTIGFCFA